MKVMLRFYSRGKHIDRNERLDVTISRIKDYRKIYGDEAREIEKQVDPKRRDPNGVYTIVRFKSGEEMILPDSWWDVFKIYR